MARQEKSKTSNKTKPEEYRIPPMMSSITLQLETCLILQVLTIKIYKKGHSPNDNVKNKVNIHLKVKNPLAQVELTFAKGFLISSLLLIQKGYFIEFS